MGGLADRRGIVADIEVDAVVFGLGERRVPTVEVDLQMVVVAPS